MRRMNYVLRSGTPVTEIPNSCTLRAIREVTGRSDTEVIDAFLAAGWKPGRGANAFTFINRVLIGSFGHRVTDIRTASFVHTYNGTRSIYVTQSQFLASRPTGVYVVMNRDHAWVIRNGRVIDHVAKLTGGRRRIIGAWEVHDAAESVYADSIATLTPYADRDAVRRRSMRMARGTDPLVKFVGPSAAARRMPHTMGRRREVEARNFLASRGGVARVSELLSNTSYRRADVQWDLERRWMMIVTDENRPMSGI